LIDCEGLFSVRRTLEDEIKMILVLCAISDFVILNSDLSSSRNINNLFDNLSKIKGKLKGKKLFQS